MKALYLVLSTLILLAGHLSCNQNPSPNAPTSSPIAATNSTGGSITPTPMKEGTLLEKDIPCTGNLTVFLNDPDLTGTNVRKEPKGAIIYQMVRKNEEEEFLIDLSQAQGGWFKVTAIEGMDGAVAIDYTAAWVHGSVLGVNTKNYGGETITIYEEATPKAPLVTSTTEVLYNLSLVDICGEWVKVKGKDFTGWIQQQWLCGSSLTNCS